jgi:hypothetical protein
MPMERNEFNRSYSPPPVGLHCNNFAVKHAFNKRLKLFKELENFRFTTQKIRSHELAIIIDEAHVMFLIAKGINGRSPNIGEHELQSSRRLANIQFIRELVRSGKEAGIINRIIELEYGTHKIIAAKNTMNYVTRQVTKMTMPPM